MASIRSFRELEVWQIGVEIVLDWYRLTEAFPVQERYGLSAQARRGAVSVVSNIAEGHNRHARRAYLNHVNIALGSLAELETLLEIATRLGYVRDGEFEPVCERMDRAGQMLRRLQQRLEFGGRMRPALLGALGCITLLMVS